MLVLVGIAVLVSNNTSEERDGFSCIPCSTACKVRVDNNSGEGDTTESITPFLVPVEQLYQSSYSILRLQYGHFIFLFQTNEGGRQNNST